MSKMINLTGVLDHMDDKSNGSDISLGEVLDSLGSRGYGPLLLALALIELLPTGAIPGVPTFIAVCVVLLAGQMVIGRTTPWVPAKLRRKGFSHDKFEKARDKIRPTTQKLDKAIKPRLAQFASPFAARIVGGICILLALTMPPLELIPFASSIPSLSIGLFGVGLGAHDGLIVLLATVVAIGAGVGVVYWLVL